MAEVRLRVGKGAYNLVNKTFNQSLLEIGSKQGITAIQTASLPTGTLSNKNVTEIENGSRSDPDRVLQRAPSQVACGISQEFETENACSDLEPNKRDSLFEASINEIVVGAKQLDTRRVYLSSGLLNNSAVSVLGRSRASHQRGTAGTGVVPKTHGLLWTTTGQRMPPQSLVSRHLLGHQQLMIIRAYSGNWSEEPLYKTKTGYYDILGVAPNATHAQIKTAYYKQSFIYHPDKNAGSEGATTRFAEVSEAYNVLGNKALRKKYDRGILSSGDLVGASRPSAKDASGSATQQQTRAGRNSPAMGADGQSIFDFDNFIKSHYSEQFLRDKELRERRAEMVKKREGGAKEWQLGKMMEMAVGVLMVMAMAILVSLKR